VDVEHRGRPKHERRLKRFEGTELSRLIKTGDAIRVSSGSGKGYSVSRQ
jgi:hypothetical protein